MNMNVALFGLIDWAVVEDHGCAFAPQLCPFAHMLLDAPEVMPDELSNGISVLPFCDFPPPL